MKRRIYIRLAVLSLVLGASVLAACTFSASSAGLGLGGVLMVLAVVFAGLAAGCLPDNQSNNLQPCLSIAWDVGDDTADAGDRSDAADMATEVGPCLTAPFDLGVCLSPLPPDMDAGVDASDLPDVADAADASDTRDAGGDGPIGPCLSPPFDAGQDAPIGPCLSVVPPDLGMPDGDMGALDQPINERERILEKMRDRLPADVLASLDDEEIA